jgi:WD40 repeat protein
MWDCRTGEAIGSPLLGHTNQVNSVCAVGQRIVSASNDGSIIIWSCDTRQLIGKPIVATLHEFILAVALSNNGRIAAGVGRDVRIFDIETREQILSKRGHAGWVRTVAFSPDGSRIASGSDDKTIRIWDAQTGMEMHRLEGHEDLVRSVAFSSDGRWIASGGDDRVVRFWDSQTGQPVGLPLLRHSGDVMGVSISSDSRLFSGSVDRTIRIWSAPQKWQKPSQQITSIHLSRKPTSSGNDRISLQGHPSVISACCSPDGSLYAASTLDGHLSIWNRDRMLLWETSTSIHPIHLLRFSESQLLLCTPYGSTLSWNLLDGKPTHEEAIPHGPQFDARALHQSASLSDDTGSWLPFDFDAGLWAYVDGCLMSFEGGERSITIVDLQDFSG